jgi:hypothetical protein
VSDTETLCNDLELHIIALYQQLRPGSTPDQQGAHSKPGSRPAFNPHIHDLLAEITSGIVDHEHRARRSLGDVSRADSVGIALKSLPHLATRLPEAPLTRLVRDLDGYVRDARTALGLNRRFKVLGPCPIVQSQPLAVGYDADGNAGAALESEECMAIDLQASRKAGKAANRFVEVYGRAHLLADLDADRSSRTGDVWCPGCGARWASAEWPRLAGMLKQETA